jgi:hypothetical protein
MYICGSDLRRELVRQARVVNGIDYLEVSDDQRSLFVHFVLPLPGTGADAVPADPARALTREHVQVTGGVRRPHIHVDRVSSAGDVLTVETDVAGDFATYTLRLRGPDTDHPDDPPPGFDPRLAEVEFSFKAGCASEFDCRPEADAAPFAVPGRPEPEIDYLAKDYASFRRLMLDRLSVTIPDWTERNPADLQVALVELLASTADRLSYRQDAVGTEAYLSTARHRTSVRRHARLLDYRMHDGTNARAFVHLSVTADVSVVPFGTAAASATALAAGTRLLAGPPDDRLVYLPLHAQRLRAAHNRIRPYTWGEEECTLGVGTTTATLRAENLDLQRGDLLLWEEERGTADPDQPPDPLRRQVVRLATVRPGHDPVTGTDVVEVTWGPADALRIPLRLSVRIPPDVGPSVEIAVARGNVVAADHGEPVRDEPLVPAVVPARGRYRPELQQAPLTFGSPYDPAGPAALALATDPSQALPAAVLHAAGLDWSPRPDLLASDGQDPGFVAEVESDGRVRLRFGDGEHGRRAQPNDQYTADYRVGNGAVGNVPAETITGIDPADPRVAGVRNPLPAAGGVEREPAELVKIMAPEAFRRQERAVTTADYADVAQRFQGVQRAAARMRWTGSWHTVFLTVDRLGGADVTPAFEADLRRYLERYRRAGHDVEVAGPVTVPLYLALSVCVRPEFLPEDVESALLDVLGSTRPTGLFHPDNLTFGQPVYLSQIYRAALGVAGVASVEATAFHRWGRAPGATVPTVVTPAPLEILRLANDPNFPEHGRLDLTVRGGR